ncbi:hypothetical protein TH61_08020 [Rufibacter sp. DG15C]|uniref:MG2 domain-containing protein n=1 Tax=Rufibacter sp. DG15C TaxID=1379909 RepID=UPI00078ECB2C|nr:MG2 domain-containing protein [Rufibacter sp. DG15C]AMM51136.1 hypothetical protein TH61_08020 [Rufibacter sp. DG15C]
MAVLLNVVGFFSQHSNAQTLSLQEQVRRVEAALVQERIALQHDKPFYLAGEQLWFNVYLSGRDTAGLSKVVYVEVRDANGKEVTSQAHLVTDNSATGDVALPKNLASGYYQVKAYTAWMKNFSQGQQFSKKILIMNAKDWRKEKSPVLTPSHTVLSQGEQLASVEEKDTLIEGNALAAAAKERLIVKGQQEGSLLVQVLGMGTQPAFLLAEAGGKVFYSSPLAVTDDLRQLEVPLSEVRDKQVRFLLLDNQGKVLAEERAEIHAPQLIRAEVFTAKEQYQPREKVTVKVRLTSGQAGVGNAQLSVAVYADPQRSWGDVKSEHHQDEALWQAIEAGENKRQHLKETEVFPLPRASGKGTRLQEAQSPITNPAVKISASVNQELQRLEAVQFLEEAYEVKRYEKLYQPIPLHMDKTFKLDQYIDFASTESAIQEVTSNLRLSKQKGKFQLRILYTDQFTKYFFKEEPLYLVDGVMVKDIDEILQLDPKDLESIQLAWKTETLSRNNLDQLAWNGIFLVNTKGAAHRERLVKRGFQALFAHLDVPYTLQEVKQESSGQETIPDLRVSLGWFPGLKTDKDGWATFEFTTSDDLDTFRVAIMGVAEQGEMVQAHKFFQVTAPPATAK